MIDKYIEAIIFAGENATTLAEIKDCLNLTFGWEISDEELEQALSSLIEKYQTEAYSFEIRKSGGGYQFFSKKEFASLINNFLNQKAKKKLSRAALETLSIIAYKQPISKTEIEQIRGVNCDYTIQKLLEKDLITITGRANGPGKPLLYGTSEVFMDYFGINSPADLPKLKEIEASHDNEIGVTPEIEFVEPLEN